MKNPFPAQDSGIGANVAELAAPNCRLRDEAPVNNTDAANNPPEDCDPDSKAELMQYGYVPFYRTWLDAGWFAVQPWSVANLFLWFYAQANRRRRNVGFKNRMSWIDRGCVATSITALVERSGLNHKTVRRMIRDLEEAGELKLEKCGADGIVVRVLNYDRYAIDPENPSKRREVTRRADG